MALVRRCLRSLGRLKKGVNVPILRPTLVRWGAFGVTLLPNVAYCCSTADSNPIPTMVLDVEDAIDIPPPETPATLSEIQEMFLQTSNSAVVLFTKTSNALVRAENEYAEIIYRLIAFHSASIDNLAAGDAKRGETIESLIIDTRLDIKEANEKREKLKMVFSSTEKLLKQVSEIAFMAGDEEASFSVYQMLCEIRKEVEDAAGGSRMAEKLLGQAQAHSIEVIGKLMEEDSVSEKEDPREDAG